MVEYSLEEVQAALGAGDASTLTDASNRFAAIAAQLGDLSDDLASGVAGLTGPGGSWHGPAATAFATAAGRIALFAQETSRTMSSPAYQGLLASGADALRGAQAKLQAILAEYAAAQAELEAYLSAMPPGAAGPGGAGLRAALEEQAAAAARAVLESLGQAYAASGGGFTAVPPGSPAPGGRPQPVTQPETQPEAQPEVQPGLSLPDAAESAEAGPGPGLPQVADLVDAGLGGPGVWSGPEPAPGGPGPGGNPRAGPALGWLDPAGPTAAGLPRLPALGVPGTAGAPAAGPAMAASGLFFPFLAGLRSGQPGSAGGAPRGRSIAAPDLPGLGGEASPGNGPGYLRGIGAPMRGVASAARRGIAPFGEQEKDARDRERERVTWLVEDDEAAWEDGATVVVPGPQEDATWRTVIRASPAAVAASRATTTATGASAPAATPVPTGSDEEGRDHEWLDGKLDADAGQPAHRGVR
jgi:hypothetical protein